MANVNGIKLLGAATGSPPEVQAVGSDTTSDLKLVAIGAGDIYSTNDGDFAGGHRQVCDDWYQDNVAASQTDVALAREGDGVWASLDGKMLTVRAGSITGVAVKISDAADTCSAGTATVEVTKNGSGVGLTAVLDATNNRYKATTQAKDADTFAAGDELGLKITTDGSWAPTTADIRAILEIET